MMTDSTAGREERLTSVSTPGLGWLMPSLSLILACVAVFQFQFFVPKAMYVVQRFGGRTPGYLSLLMDVPAWLALVTAIAFIAVVIRQRSSLRKSTLLASVATAANVGLIVSVLGSLFEVLSRA